MQRPSRTHAGRSCRAVCAALLVAGLSFQGCAGAGGWRYSDEPGVRATVLLADGSRLSGTVVGFEQGAYLLDCSVAKSERLEVVRREGRDVAYEDGVAIGSAVEVRDFDVVVRRRIPLMDVEELRIATRTYVGWGTVIAAALSFFFFQLLEQQS